MRVKGHVGVGLYRRKRLRPEGAAGEILKRCERSYTVVSSARGLFTTG
jgi:hypothetical protein